MEFILTEKSKAKLMEMKSNNKPIKLKITAYTWCGARLGIVSEKQDDIEKVYNVDGIDIIVSDELEGAIKGAKIDYSTSFFMKGFDVVPIYT
jgi:Fe-S cluster assembly iron-binding protein IscA